MPPKQRITREMILEHAFGMLCQSGMETVNARSIARALGCSTQPIFSCFSGMDDLKQTLRERAEAVYEEYTAQAESFVDRCVAYVRFAESKPQIFKYLFSGERGSLPEMAQGEKPGIFAAAHGFAIMLVSGCGNADSAEETLRKIDAAL